MRHFAATSLDADAALDQVTAFPLAGGRAAGPRFWAVFHPAADLCRIARRAGREARFGCTKPVLVVHARRDGAWREVAHYVVPRMETVSVVAPVEVEPSQAWIVIRGFDEHAPGTGDGAPFWQLLRFDGDSLHIEVEGYWRGFMIADVDGDGAGEFLRRDAVPLCFRCDVTQRVVRLYRWTGTRLARVPLEFLPAGSAPAAAVAANNRAVALARARRWTEAAAVLDTARPLVAEHPAFGRNAGLIDLNAAAPAGDRLSEDPLLDAVFAGAWVRAVGHFRASARRPDAFVGSPPFPAASVRAMDPYGAPALVRAVFDATAAARAVAPARPEIEFLHAWAAFHLDPDLAGPPPARPARRRGLGRRLPDRRRRRGRPRSAGARRRAGARRPALRGCAAGRCALTRALTSGYHQEEPTFEVDSHRVRCVVRVRPDWPGNLPASAG